MSEPAAPVERGRSTDGTGGAVAAVADGLLAAVVVGFALWTVCYHAAVLLDWTVDATLMLWGVLVLVAGVAASRIPWRPGQAGSATTDPSARVAAVALALVGACAGWAAGTRVLDEPGWYGFWAAGLLVCVGGVVIAARGREQSAPREISVGNAGAMAVVLAALTFAVLSAVTVRPDADDVFLVNRSSWIEEKGGQFPELDTIFSDEVLRPNRPERPPTAIEPLVGGLARILPVRSPTVAYLFVAPAVSALGVLALWRLLRTLRAPAPAAACIAGAAFLALDGAVHTSFGNMSFARAWQGKVAFLLVVVPLLWHWALRWSRDGDRRSLVALVAGGVAGVGLTSTAVLVAPPVIVLGTLAGTRSTNVRRVLLAVAALAYPLGAGIVAAGGISGTGAIEVLNLAVARGTAFAAQVGVPAPLGGVGGLDPADAWHTAMGEGIALGIASFAVLVAWIATRDRAARLALALAPAFVLAVTGSPAAIRMLDDATGARTILWRMVWVMPVAAAVGLVATAPALLPRGLPRSVLTVALPLAVVASMLIAGTPVWSRDNGTRVGMPAWDVYPDDLDAANRLVEMSEPGDTVMAPEPVGTALAITSIDVRAVNPRELYMQGRSKRRFRTAERILLSRAATTGISPEETGAVLDALAVLSVDAACITPHLVGSAVDVALGEAGFAPAGADAVCAYYRPAP